jgi:hypothetical protein
VHLVDGGLIEQIGRTPIKIERLLEVVLLDEGQDRRLP